jgi:hypothetical protein
MKADDFRFLNPLNELPSVARGAQVAGRSAVPASHECAAAFCCVFYATGMVRH